MIASLALVLTAASVPPSVDEIVIIGQRVDALSINVARDREGKLHCSLSASSGIRDLDDRLCRAGAKCVRKHDADHEKVERCMKDGKSALLAKFKREWERSRK